VQYHVSHDNVEIIAKVSAVKLAGQVEIRNFVLIIFVLPPTSPKIQ